MNQDDIKSLARNLPGSPGVYRMLGPGAQVLYVGKARNLKKRVQSYFRASGLAARILSMMQQVVDIEGTVTHTENEALILESNLIKSLKPRYNILLRDDKSYPYLFLSERDFPRLAYHRGARRARGRYFGPYPSATAVRESLNLLQKLFRVRQCDDSFYRHRSRPCLQYQIKRCSGPCVGMVDATDYAEDVRHTVMFLEGKNQEVIAELVKAMEIASAQLQYEQAGHYRDQIASLKRVQEQQFVSGEGGDVDALAALVENSLACVCVSFIRSGRLLGNKNFFPRIDAEAGVADVLGGFLSQYYSDKLPPAEILLNQAVDESELFEQAFSQQLGKRVRLHWNVRGARRRWLQLAEVNAADALRRHMLSRSTQQRQMEALQEALALDSLPERLECFDISHTQGEAPVGACVVFGREGALRSDYRRFNIRNVTPGDDYGAMREALMRRYQRLQQGEGIIPDVLFIDGGKGQLGTAAEVLQELQVAGLTLVGVAKGEGRKPGLERLFLWGREAPLILPPDSAALHLIQQIRDEAHRFAISGHRRQRARSRTRSPLESIPGVGDRRRQALLKHLGGLQEVARAGVNDLARVPGISPVLAQKIYDAFHDE